MYKLMIAEDSPFALKELCEGINWAKYDLCLTGAFSDGEQLLEQAIKDMPDVVLTDIFMPIMDGISLASALRALSKDVKIVFVSSCADFEIAQKALLMHVSGYLLKDFEESQFDDVMKQVLRELREAGRNKKIGKDIVAEEPNNNLKMPKDYVGRMKQFIHENYMEDISMADVSSSVFLSSSYANLKFTQKCGCSIFEYISECRMTEAKRLLKETDESITRIAELVGYTTKTNFYLAFKKREGISPKDYRKKERGKFINDEKVRM